MPSRLKKIELRGFKSFKNKTEIPLTGGFTGLTGPNGSGKSNLIEAITFALGKMSRKDLRADTLDQVIFVGNNGSSAKKAKVSLYFNNSDEAFPVETPTLKITREVKKESNSIYKINGKRSTRTRILDLLSRINLRPDGHNIIFQGEVTDIIERSPDERREIIDEVAGIKHYEEKKERAVRELEDVEENLKEIEIVLNHKNEYLTKLKKEKEDVEKFEELREKLTDFEKSLLAVKLQKAEKEEEFVRKRIEELEKTKKKLDKKMKEIKKKIKKIEEKLEEINTKILKQGGEGEAKLNKKIEELKGKIARRENKKASNQEEIKRLQRLINEVTDLQKRTRGKSKAVKSILGLKEEMKGIYGTVSQLYSTDPKYSLALSVSAGAASNFIIVDSSDTAVFCVKYLKRKRIGRATFLPLDKIKGKKLSHLPKIEGIEGLAVDLIDFDKKFRSIFNYIFGKTVIVTDIDKAKNIGVGRFRMVTLDGDKVEKSGIVSGGFRKKNAEVRLSVDSKKYKKEIEGLEKENLVLNKEIKKLKNRLVEKKETLNKSRKDLKDLYTKIDEIKKKISKKKTSRDEIYDDLIEKESKLNNLKIQKAKIETNISELKTEAKKYEDLEIKYEKEPSKLREKITTIKIQLNELKPVNFKAVEDYNLEKEEFRELKGKVVKLNEEKEKILNTMQQIKEKKKEIFMDALESISSNFNQIFKRLSNGKGELMLEDSEDLDSGLLIKAMPAGKKLKSIDAMSRGEKTLTVLAFIFAIQQYKPAPFYILDEVDAALDSENSKKFANLLQDFSRNSQILLISHNKDVLPMADQVFGVTMNENGESSLVGVRLA